MSVARLRWWSRIRRGSSRAVDLREGSPLVDASGSLNAWSPARSSTLGRRHDGCRLRRQCSCSGIARPISGILLTILARATRLIWRDQAMADAARRGYLRDGVGGSWVVGDSRRRPLGLGRGVVNSPAPDT